MNILKTNEMYFITGLKHTGSSIRDGKWYLENDWPEAFDLILKSQNILQ